MATKKRAAAIDVPQDDLHAYLTMVHEAAASTGGKLILAAYGANPDTGRKLHPLHAHFAPGDVDGMAEQAEKWSIETHRNVYVGLSAMRPDLPTGYKGAERDVLAVLGLVFDFDAKNDNRASEYAERLPLPPDAVIETSPGSFQAVYILSEPASPADAKPIAVAIAERSGCDMVSKDLCHVWRPAGTLNYPSRDKIAAGRSSEPFKTRFAKPWGGKSRTTLEDLRRELSSAAASNVAPFPITTPAQPKKSSANPIVFNDLPRALRALIAEGAPAGTRSDQFMSAVAQLKERGAAPDDVVALLTEYPEGIAAKFRGRLSKEVDRCYKKVPDLTATKNEFSGPILKVVAGELHTLTTEAETALLRADAPIYVRGPHLVRPVTEEVEAAHGHKTKIARLAEVDADTLVDQFSRVAQWVKYDARAKKYLPTDPPRSVALTLLSRDGERRLRPLVGVITTPTLRPDGSILAAAGYDPQTRFLLVDPPAMPATPSTPTRADAEASLQRLADLLEEFPFVDEASRSVALSAIITPVVRGAMSVAPLHVVRAPTAGSSKSYLIDVAAAVATGRPCPVLSAGANGEELEKRLDAALLKGQPIISIDNLNGDLQGDKLCQVVERPLVEVRRLGASENVSIESRATIYATGNNITVVGDMVRRAILCSLDTNLERPELRQFKKSPMRMILNDRGRYIADALIVVRAYIEAGCPGELPTLASFESWSRLVRSALVWLGCADPVLSMEATRREDPETVALTQFVEAWASQPLHSEALTASELIDRASFPTEGSGTNSFSEALSDVAGDSRGGVSAKSLGRWIMRHEGRVVVGHKIKRRLTRGRGHRWSLEPIMRGGT